MDNEEENKEQPRYGRGQHPNSKKALRPQVAGMPSHNPNGRPKGSKDRASVLRKLMNIKVPVHDPRHPEQTKEVTLYEAAALGQFKAAQRGNTFAWKEIQDTLHGPMPTKIKGEFDFTFATLAKAAAYELNGGQYDEHGDESAAMGNDNNGNGFHPEQEAGIQIELAANPRSEDDSDSIGDSGSNSNHGGELEEAGDD